LHTTGKGTGHAPVGNYQKREDLAMAENGNGNRFVPMKLLISILLALLFAASSIIIADTRSGVTTAQVKIDQLQKDKVDKEQYCRDINEIKAGINSLVKMHMGNK
jgi:hypothetical protein